MSFFLASKLRKASDTIAIEKERDNLQKDFEEYEAFSNSEELKDFYELEKDVLSEEFKNKKKEIEKKSYKKSELYREEREFKRLQKSKKFTTYFRLKDSKEISDFEMMRESDEFLRFNELQSLVTSAGFSKKKQLEEFREFKAMKNSKQIKDFFKFQKSREYKTYCELDQSKQLKRYFELEEKISSDEFQEKKAFLLDKKRFEKTDEYKKIQKYQQLKNSEIFQKYFRLKKKNPFEELKKWELSFYEEFNAKLLNENKWITRYYWGDELLGKNYSLEGDLHVFTDDKNIRIEDSVASLEARKERQKGMLWTSSHGFVPNEFDYTSAILNTGRTFRQKYGRFEAKIQVKNSKQAQPSFWMVGDQQVPHVTIFKTSNAGNLLVGNVWKNGHAVDKGEYKIKGIDLEKGYFIYSLDWNSNELVWKINDVIVRKQTKGVPQESMYINFSIGVKEEQLNLQAAMNIDWVRCYKRKE